MTDKTSGLAPACRTDVTPEQLQHEADRAMVYGACLLLVRPETRIKPQFQTALVPAIKAYYTGVDAALAADARAYADDCGARAFLDQKAALDRERQLKPGTDLGSE